MTLTVVEAPVVLAMAVSRLLADSGSGGVATLTGSRIVRDVADAGTAYPFIAVSWLSSEALQTANAEHVFSDVLLLVKTVDQGSSRANLEAIESRIVSILDGYGGVTLRGVYLVKLRLERQVPQPDTFIDSKRYLYSNLVFKSEAEPS